MGPGKKIIVDHVEQCVTSSHTVDNLERWTKLLVNLTSVFIKVACIIKNKVRPCSLHYAKQYYSAAFRLILLHELEGDTEIYADTFHLIHFLFLYSTHCSHD